MEPAVTLTLSKAGDSIDETFPEVGAGGGSLADIELVPLAACDSWTALSRAILS